jgi:hypothetical protein
VGRFRAFTKVDDELARQKTAATEGSIFLSNYRDETDTARKLYWGEIESVVDRPADDTGWLVLMEEPVDNQGLRVNMHSRKDSFADHIGPCSEI